MSNSELSIIEIDGDDDSDVEVEHHQSSSPPAIGYHRGSQLESDDDDDSVEVVCVRNLACVRPRNVQEERRHGIMDIWGHRDEPRNVPSSARRAATATKRANSGRPTSTETKRRCPSMSFSDHMRKFLREKGQDKGGAIELDGANNEAEHHTRVAHRSSGVVTPPESSADSSDEEKSRGLIPDLPLVSQKHVMDGEDRSSARAATPDGDKKPPANPSFVSRRQPSASAQESARRWIPEASEKTAIQVRPARAQAEAALERSFNCAAVTRLPEADHQTESNPLNVGDRVSYNGGGHPGAITKRQISCAGDKGRFSYQVHWDDDHYNHGIRSKIWWRHNEIRLIPIIRSRRSRQIYNIRPFTNSDASDVVNPSQEQEEHARKRTTNCLLALPIVCTAGVLDKALDYVGFDYGPNNVMAVIREYDGATPIEAPLLIPLGTKVEKWFVLEETESKQRRLFTGTVVGTDTCENEGRPLFKVLYEDEQVEWLYAEDIRKIETSARMIPRTEPSRSFHALELFSGTGNVSSAFKRQGCTSDSVDNDESANASVFKDIMKLDPEKDLTRAPDIIHASPPCHTYSKLAGGNHRALGSPTDFDKSPEAVKQDLFSER